MNVGTTGTGAPTSRIFDNIIAGNINGIGVSDNGRTTSVTGPFVIVNNTIADNTTGLYNVSSTPNAMQALVVNDIFYFQPRAHGQPSGDRHRLLRREYPGSRVGPLLSERSQ